MDLELQKSFENKWHKFFGNAELPICMWYADEANIVTPEVEKKPSCIIANLARVRKGHNLCVNKFSIGCGGALRYLGYSDKLKPDFEYFLSCGNERMEGERYVQSPEEVVAWLNRQQFIPIHNRNAHFKRWDKLTGEDRPELVIFFAKADVLSGLFTLFNYCNFKEKSIEAPFGAGCSSIITKPYLNPDKAFIGLFDPTARKFIPENILTFSFHFNHMATLTNAMDNSFLTTKAWTFINERLRK